MKVYHSRLILNALLACVVILTGCSRDDSFSDAHDTWQADRMARLKTARGWLSLAGLYQIKPGASSVGFSDTSAIHFSGPSGSTLGTIILDSSQLSWIIHDTRVTSDSGRPYPGGRIDIMSPPLLNLDAYYWTFLERSGNYYLRLWDTLSSARLELREITSFPPDKRWSITGSFTPALPGTTIVLDDVLGLRREYPVEGEISGTWKNSAFTLIALEGGENELFIIFEDATTGVSTYDAGRYLYVPRPAENDSVEIDFNKSYNPPCAFTEYATCLLAPPQNRLSFTVTAGEKTYGH